MIFRSDEFLTDELSLFCTVDIDILIFLSILDFICIYDILKMDLIFWKKSYFLQILASFFHWCVQ